MLINGQSRQLPQPLPLSQLLQDLGYRPQLIAVELNGDIIPRTAFEATIVDNSATLEIVSFVGGG